MLKTDKIAILMATYNGERFVSEQIESLLKQTYQDWELFIHDDGSEDNTVNIITQLAKEYPTKIHVVEGKETGGAKYNFFYLMHQVDAPYIMFCDQDDIWLETKIEKTYLKMRETESGCGIERPILVFTDLEVVDSKLRVLAERMSKSQKLNPRKIRFKDCLIQNVITGCTTMLNRACLEKSLAEVDFKNIIMHDWWCALVAAYYGKIAFVDEPLILYRQHGNNSVGAKPLSDPRYVLKRMTKQKDIKSTLELTRKQSGEFARAYCLDKDSLAFQYSNLATKPKLSRQLFYGKNHVWKSGLIRNIGLLMWG